ncbi:hypothetical protein O6H91_Y238700 [Diphasiastrum complanatum]|nr:hypothetical protein O6H91_Y238700 [Diphasiastrum complanatum]
METTGIMQSRKFPNVPVSLASKTQSLDSHATFLEPSVHWRTINTSFNRTTSELLDVKSREAESRNVAMFRRDTETAHEALYQEFSHVPKRLRSEDLPLPSATNQDSSLTYLDSVGMMQSLRKEVQPLVSAKGNNSFRHVTKNSSWVSPQLPSPRSYNPLDEPSPLGLRLRKSPSLLELISMSVAQGSSSASLAVAPSADAVMQGLIMNKDAAALTQDKLKASNFPAAVLKIGTWECYSRYEGDLVAKCYYAKRKLVWEVLENGLKSKIEIQWSDISAIKASYPENEPGTLEIEVSRPPLFFRELNPQPRKHTLWQTTSDFTGGEATISRRHYLQFLEGVLNKHYEKLLQCDPRLKALASGITTSVSGVSNSTQFEEPETSCQLLKCETSETCLHDDVQDRSLFSQSSIKPTDEGLTNVPRVIPKFEFGVQSVHTPSPSSVIDTRGGEETASSDGDLCVKDEFSSGLHSEGINLMPAREAQDKLEHELLSSSFRFMEDSNRFLERNVLDEIAQVLLGEPLLSIASHEEAFALATRVHAMSASLAQDVQYSAPLLTSEEMSLNSFPANMCLPRRLQVDEPRSGREEDMEDVKPFKESNFKWELSGMLENSSDSSKPWLTKNNSAGDLLVNLPRIASLPQFFDSQTHKPF